MKTKQNRIINYSTTKWLFFAISMHFISFIFLMYTNLHSSNIVCAMCILRFFSFIQFKCALCFCREVNDCFELNRKSAVIIFYLDRLFSCYYIAKKCVWNAAIWWRIHTKHFSQIHIGFTRKHTVKLFIFKQSITMFPYLYRFSIVFSFFLLLFGYFLLFVSPSLSLSL